MGLFRSPRSRPGGSGALVRRKAGSAHQTDRITSLVSKWGCSAHHGAGQVALVRRKAGSAHQTDRITSLVSKWGCSAHQGAGQVALVRRKGRFRSPNRPNHQSREQMGLFRSPRSRPGGSGAQEGRFRSQNRPDHQSREQMGLFRSPRSRPGALVRRKAGSAHQTGRITSLVSKWGCSAHQGAGQVLWCAGRPVPLTKSNRCGHGRSAVGSGLLATGSWQSAAGCWQRAAGSGQRGTNWEAKSFAKRLGG